MWGLVVRSLGFRAFWFFGSGGASFRVVLEADFAEQEELSSFRHWGL